jgi:hypothetical protein
MVKTASAPSAKGDRHNTSPVTNVNIEKTGGCGEKSFLTTHHPSVLGMDLTEETLRTGLTSVDVFWRLETKYDATD